MTVIVNIFPDSFFKPMVEANMLPLIVTSILIGAGVLAAGEIAQNFPVSGAAVSKHLTVLKEADLIRDTRMGKYIYYDLNTSVLEEVMLWLTALKGE